MDVTGRSVLVEMFCELRPVLFDRVGSISVHDTFGTKGGRFRYVSISVQMRSPSVHVNSAYATVMF